MMTLLSTRSDDRRSSYLRAAMRLFAEHGFDGTTTDMLVAEVGGSKATLYKHFASKEHLVAGLMDEVIGSISATASDPADDHRALDEVLNEIGTAVVKGVVEPQAQAVLRLCLGEYHRFPELSQVVWEHGPAVTYAAFRAMLGVRQERGEVDVEDTQLAAEQFIAGLVGHVQLKVAMGISPAPDDDEIERRVASASATFLARYATA